MTTQSDGTSDYRHSNQHNDDAPPSRSTFGFIFGLVLVFLQVVMWIADGYGAKFLKDSDYGNYNQPILLQMFCKGVLMIFFPVWLIVTSTSIAPHARTRPIELKRQSYGNIIVSKTCYDCIGYEDSVGEPKLNDVSPLMEPITLQTVITPKRFTLGRFILCAVCMAPLSVGVSVLWYYSLAETTMAVNSSLYMSYIVFVYILSVVLQGESVTLFKVLSVVLCLGGVVIISFLGGGNQSTTPTGVPSPTPTSSGGASDSHNSVFGIVATLLSAFLYGLYQVVFSKYAVDPTSSSPAWDCVLFAGLFGVTTTATNFILVGIMQGCHLHDFALPLTVVAWLILGICMLNGLLFNLFNVLAIVWTNPLFVSVGSVLTIPITALIDYFAFHIAYSIWDGVGAAVVIIGFVLLTILQHREQKAKSR